MISFQSPQLASRRHLIEWSTEVIEIKYYFWTIYILCRLNLKVSGKLGLCGATLHLALRIIDLFMDGHDIQVLV